MGYHWDIVVKYHAEYTGIGQTNQHYLGVYVGIYRNGYKGDLYVCNPAIWGLVPDFFWESPISSTGSFHFP